jgi:nucleoside-triphosphatase THEP1
MGAGVLPTTIYKNKLYFLFGKENQFADTPGWSDFGGGTDNNETYLQTAIREGTEETTGFLGDLRDLLSRGTYEIMNDNTYKMFLFAYEYDPMLPYYYNNNHRFLEKKLDVSILKKSKIFEKSEIKWICIDELSKMRGQFRHYFRQIVDRLLDEEDAIYAFMNRRRRRERHSSKSRLRTSKNRGKNRGNKTR